ncbi:MAG: metalloregulator ArsR/SmtB family transcription factor [Chloroflexota bacterium]
MTLRASPAPVNVQSTKLTETQAELFGVLANSTRIRILQTIAKGELSVGEIAQEVQVSIQNTSHHLRYMRDKGLLRSRRVGQSIRYRIANPGFVQSLLSRASKRPMA